MSTNLANLPKVDKFETQKKKILKIPIDIFGKGVIIVISTQRVRVLITTKIYI